MRPKLPSKLTLPLDNSAFIRPSRDNSPRSFDHDGSNRMDPVRRAVFDLADLGTLPVRMEPGRQKRHDLCKTAATTSTAIAMLAFGIDQGINYFSGIFEKEVFKYNWLKLLPSLQTVAPITDRLPTITTGATVVAIVSYLLLKQSQLNEKDANDQACIATAFNWTTLANQVKENKWQPAVNTLNALISNQKTNPKEYAYNLPNIRFFHQEDAKSQTEGRFKRFTKLFPIGLPNFVTYFRKEAKVSQPVDNVTTASTEAKPLPSPRTAAADAKLNFLYAFVAARVADMYQSNVQVKHEFLEKAAGAIAKAGVAEHPDVRRFFREIKDYEPKAKDSNPTEASQSMADETTELPESREESFVASNANSSMTNSMRDQDVSRAKADNHSNSFVAQSSHLSGSVQDLGGSASLSSPNSNLAQSFPSAGSSSATRESLAAQRQ